jgi:hypothetical protein
MKMKMKMNCLFGGALLGAGLCAGSGSTAFGGDFVWGYQTSTNIAGGGFDLPPYFVLLPMLGQ